MVQLQNSISKHLHHHTFSSMLFNGTSKAHYAQILSCFGPRVGIWRIVRPIFPTFWLFSLFFSFAFRTWLVQPHPSIRGVSWCVCTHPINLMGIHLLRCADGNERIRTHDVIYDTFVAIAWNVGFHLGRKQLHALLSTTLNSFHQWINIMLTKNDIHILIDVVIRDPIRTDLFPRSCAIQGFVTFDAIQAKERSFHNWHPESIPPLNNWSIWMFTQTCQYVFTWLC
jgi:hypothetical protein